MSDTTTSSVDTSSRVLASNSMISAAEIARDPLSDLLISRGFVTLEQVQMAINTGKSNKTSPIKILIEAGHLKQADYDALRKELQDRQIKNMRIPGYEVQSFLGSGAMASVFKCRQLSLDRVVAIKVLPQKYSEDPEFVRRFAEEGKIAAKLNHPNIVQAYDEGMANKQHYFVMEYIDGTSVHDVINQQGAYNEKDTLTIAILIADALAHAHQVGLIHRDVKPKNIMLTAKGVPKLADMGLAVLSSGPGEDEKGKIFGTPAYLAPEQATANAVLDARTDIYSFGATLFHMLIGRIPFPGNNATEMIQRHLREPVECPLNLNKNISSGISDIIEVCMAKDPAARYGSADDLLEDLKSVQRGEPPTIARKAFTIDSLSAIDAPKSIEVPKVAVSAISAEQKSEEKTKSKFDIAALMKQPLFWPAVIGWALAVLFLIVAITK